MEIHFLGAAQVVTGSMHLIRTDRGSVLLDCGMFQGRREEARQKNSVLPVDAVRADAMILSHAHIDHSGSIPTLVKSGFTKTIFATPATRDLCAWMLRDSAKIQTSDALFLNRKNAHDPAWKPIIPLYEDADAVRALSQMVSVPYHRTFDVLPGVRATFLDAGHILGSAEILLEIEDKGKTRRVLFSGDLGRKGMPIIKDPEYPTVPADYILMESTYGNRAHGDIQSMHADLERIVKETVAQSGTILIPAFAVGRTQEVLYALHYLQTQNRLPRIPVFIDSPLGVHVTDVFKLHPECFDEEARAFYDAQGDLFDFAGVTYVQSVEESKRLNDQKGPAIIIASSGMCEAGRILHHLFNRVEDPANTILIVGYQAEHTLGRKIVEKQPRIRILGQERQLRARVEVMNAFSAHGDKNDLLEFAMKAGKDSQRIFLVHGEPDSQDALKKTLEEHHLKVSVPALGEVAEL